MRWLSRLARNLAPALALAALPAAAPAQQAAAEPAGARAELVRRLAEAERRLQAARAEVAQLKQQLAELEKEAPDRELVRVRQPIVHSGERSAPGPVVPAPPARAEEPPAPQSAAGREDAAPASADPPGVDPVWETAGGAEPDEAVASPTAGLPLEAVARTVQDWAAAWSAQDIEGYLSHYSVSFRPPSGLSRLAWEAQRKERLADPTYIAVDVSELRVRLAGGGRAEATFRQDYRSNSFEDSVEKTLTLVEEDGSWRILAEETVE